MGATSKDAFYVRCGLGTTMTQQDIVNGRLLIEIGMAPVRPAEFVIVRYSKSPDAASLKTIEWTEVRGYACGFNAQKPTRLSP